MAAKQFYWKISHQLTIAGAIIIVPIFVIAALFINEKSEEIDLLEQQVRATRFIEPTYLMLRDVALHRGLINMDLQHPLQEEGGEQRALLQQVRERIEQQLDQLVGVEQFGPKIDEIISSWSQLRRADEAIAPVADEVFEQHDVLIQYLLSLLYESMQQGHLFADMKMVMTRRIPLLAEDFGQLRGLTAGYLVQSGSWDQQCDLKGLESGSVMVEVIQKYRNLISRDFIELRTIMERSFGEGEEHQQMVPLLYELVSEIQAVEDLVQWEIMESDGRCYNAWEFFQETSRPVDALFEVAFETRRIYLQRLYTLLEDRKSERGWIVMVLFFSILLTLFLASSIVSHIVTGIRQGMRLVDELGQGNYHKSINKRSIAYYRSSEIKVMMESIERARINLRNAARETRKALKGVESQKNFLADLTDNMQHGVYALDQQGLLQFINPEAERLLGYRAEELMGKNIHDVIHSHLPDGTPVSSEDCPVYKSIRKGHTYQIDRDWFIRKDGSMMPVEFNTAPLMDGGEVRGSVAVFNDISSRLEMEAKLKESVIVAEDASRTKSDFLATMSHEIRTPMNAIIGVAYLTLQTDMSEKQRGYIDKIHHAAKSLLGIINDILDFSKVEAGKLDLENIPFSLEESIDQLDQLMTVKAEEKGVDLLFLVDESIPARLVGDPHRLNQVLVNLTNNALKFTDQGTVTVHVTLQEKSNRKAEVHFSVVDQGIGMSQEQLDGLFRAFTQADSSTTRKYGGTGLGLTISRQLVELMGGEIEVKSQLGRGSTFSFILPLQIDDRKESQLRTPKRRNRMSGAEIVADIRGARILLVEDNEVNQMVAIELLELVGFEVTVANHGREALQQLEQALTRQQPFDAVLMDIQMPVMDGYEATEVIREDDRYQALPVIAMTANAMVQDKEEAAAAGMDDHIAKPINPENLYSTLRKWVEPQPHHQPLLATEEGTEQPIFNGEGTLLDSAVEESASSSCIDRAVGLRQVGGHELTYLKIVEAFVRNQGKAVEQIRHQLEKQAWEDAERAAHSMKGVSGTIGAAALHQLAIELEQALKEQMDSEALQQLMEKTEEALEAVVAEIEQMVEQQSAAPTSAGTESGVGVSLEEVRPQLEALEEQISSYEMEATDQLEALLRQLEDGALRQALKKVYAALEQYDFDAALERMQALLQSDLVP